MSSLSPTPPSPSPDAPTQAARSVSRRTLIAGSAWAVPAIVTATAVPAAAAASDGAPIDSLNMNVGRLEAGGSAPVEVLVRDANYSPKVGVLVTFSSSANVTISPTSTLTDSDGFARATVTSTSVWERPGSGTSETAQVTDKGNTRTIGVGAVIGGANAYGVGDNAKSHLGTGSTDAYGATAAQLARKFYSTLESVVSGADFTLAWSAEGNVISVIGANDRGQLGLGDTRDRSEWEQVGGNWDDDPSQRPWWGKSDDTATVQIAAGRQSAYVLLANGDVYAWGANEAGQLNVANTTDKLEPALVARNAAAIAAGDDFLITLDRGGKITTAGSNDHGQRGDISLRDHSGIVQVAAGDKTGYALTDDGKVLVWGSNDKGQRGLDFGETPDEEINWSTGSSFAAISGVIRIAAGHQSVYALRSDGTVWAWGRNNVGQLGDGTTTNRSTPVQVTGLQNVVEIAANGESARALLSNGEIRSWGGNGAGVLGDGSTANRTTPVTTTGTQNVARLGASSSTGTAAYLLTEDRRVQFDFTDPQYLTAGEETWLNAKVASPTGAPVSARGIAFTTRGATVNGVNTSNESASARVEVEDVWTTPGTVVRAEAKSGFARASRLLNVRGSNAYAVGVNFHGQFGNGQEGNWPSTPAQLPRVFPMPIVQVAAGEDFTLVLLSDGTVWSAGANDAGQLADGTGQRKARTTWARVSGVEGIEQIAAGKDWALALTSGAYGARVWAWGRNAYGQIGSDQVSDTSVFDTPTQIDGLYDVDQIAAGRFTAYARIGGTAYAWGRNDLRQMGAGWGDDYRSTPRQVQNLTNIVQLTAAGSSAHVILDNGEVWGWGDNSQGQLGVDNSVTPAGFFGEPLKVNGLTDKAAQIACAFDTVFIRTTGGEVRSLGSNAHGRLGTGVSDTTLTMSSAPQKVTGLTDIVDISASVASGYALTPAGTVMSWGANGDGQLGDGTHTDSATPVAMTSIAGVIAQISPASPASFAVFPRHAS
ncbi:Ig-like domain-containing protein [Microbacterium sp. NPDC089180]|uniref:RCC1 domain-containing protein n=1 Tax=unclassified Microbacterium TaxID=2609290 RepID=UPI003425DF9D